MKRYQLVEHPGRDTASLKLSPKQQAVYEELHQSAEPLRLEEIQKRADCGKSPVEALRNKGLIEVVHERSPEFAPEIVPITRDEDLKLNSQQQRAVDAIVSSLKAREHRTFLLRGVTVSGKTEVYIQAIREVVSYGKQAIVLVPEISLTPQAIGRFRARFDSVAVLHSHLSDAERYWHWQRIKEGKVQVIVGARSAVFAPAPHLGLIVIDEEHESSFKQDATPRYHTRDVARQRAKMENIPLILGSATPALESWERAIPKPRSYP
jgi:primosomal protein N' (replication factor Y)